MAEIDENINDLQRNRDAPSKPANPIDKFFAEKHGSTDVPSPIKSQPAKMDDTDSLELKLDEHTESVDLPAVSKCIQPDEPSSIDCAIAELKMDEISDIQPQPSEEPLPAVEAEDIKAEHPVEKDDFHPRKRPQDAMDPAPFDFTRAMKQPHKDAPNLPEFRDDVAPLIKFTSGNEEVFKPQLQVNGVEVQLESPNKKTPDASSGNTTFTISTSGQPDLSAIAEETREAEEVIGTIEPSTVESELSSYRAMPTRTDMNQTVDMTLRTTGGQAFLTGFLSALDEALDPVLGFLLPHGLRRRGANLVIILCSILLSIILYFFM